jgi:hypothetical protein
MAKKQRDTSVNKTAEILGCAKSNKGAKPKDISEALKAKGVNVSAGYVSSVLSNAKRNRKKPGRKKSAAASNGAVTVDSIIAAAKFIKSAGGIDNAKAALKAAEAVAASV